MFNTNHYHTHRTQLVTQEVTKEVKEFRAPTDESIRLLNEMQDKARRNIIEQVTLKSSFLEASVIYYKDDYVAGRVLFHAKFTLNEKEYFLENAIDGMDWRVAGSSLRHESIYNLILKTFTEAIAQEFTKEAFKLI